MNDLQDLNDFDDTRSPTSCHPLTIPLMLFESSMLDQDKCSSSPLCSIKAVASTVVARVGRGCNQTVGDGADA